MFLRDLLRLIAPLHILYGHSTPIVQYMYIAYLTLQTLPPPSTHPPPPSHLHRYCEYGAPILCLLWIWCSYVISIVNMVLLCYVYCEYGAPMLCLLWILYSYVMTIVNMLLLCYVYCEYGAPMLCLLWIWCSSVMSIVNMVLLCYVYCERAQLRFVSTQKHFVK